MTSAQPVTVLTAAMLIGTLGDTLLRGGTWRMGFLLFVTSLATAVLVIGRRGTRERNWLVAGVVLAATGLVLRESELLYVIDMLSVLGVGALLICHGAGTSLTTLHAVNVPRIGVLAVLNSVGGAPRVIGRSVATDGDGERRSQTLRALLIGVALALPPLAVVTMLLASSDPVFNALLERIFAIRAVTHVLFALLLAWCAAGWLRAALGDAIGASIPEFRAPALPFTTISVVLYALLALLGVFIAMQGRVLFGGEAFLQATQDMSIATYARRGFFEMILASGVVLTTLVIAEWLLPRDDDDAHLRYRRLAIALLVLVAAVLASAAARIGLYVDRFGLTTDRVLASAVIVWVVGALVLFGATTARRRPAQLMPAVIGMTVIWVILLNVINPESLVVRANVARARSGATFDVPYHVALSADALPALIESAARLGVVGCRQLQAGLLAEQTKRRVLHDAADWRSTSLPARRAAGWYARAAAIRCT